MLDAESTVAGSSAVDRESTSPLPPAAGDSLRLRLRPGAVKEIALGLLDDTGDVIQAASRLEDLAEKHPQLREEILRPWISRACYELVSKAAQSERRSIWGSHRQTDAKIERDNAASKRRVLAHARSLMDFRLPGGRALRDCKAGDIALAAEFYEKQAHDMAWKARWMRAVAGAIGSKTVARALTAEQLEEMMQEAQTA